MNLEEFFVIFNQHSNDLIFLEKFEHFILSLMEIENLSNNEKLKMIDALDQINRFRESNVDVNNDDNLIIAAERFGKKAQSAFKSE